MWCEIFRKISVLLLVAAVFSPSALYAACSSPAGVAGEMGYNLTGSGEMEYCDDTNWISMDSNSGATLIGHWKLDETSGSSIADSAGSNTGTWSDGVNDDVAEETVVGIDGNALLFDGSDDMINLGSGASLDNIAPLTVCAWVYPVTLPSGFASIITKIPSGTDAASGWDFYTHSSGDVGFSTWNGGYKQPNGLVTGSWQHICATWDGSSGAGGIFTYRNGAYIVSSGGVWGTSTLDDSANNMTIGRLFDGGGAVNFRIDDVRLYDGAMTEEDVLNLYLSSALVGHWKLDETSGTVAADSSGNGYNGTMSGFDGANGTVDGKVGTALTFVDGSADRIFMGDNLDLIGMPFTISAWIKPNSISNDDSIVDKLASGGNYRFKLDNNGVLAFGIRDASNVYQGFGTASNAVETGKWTHVAVSYDNATTGTIYVNGVQSAQKTDFSITRGDVSTQLAFGYSNNNSAWFNGAIDDVRIYSVDLSPAQITDIYYCSRPGLSYYDSTDHVSKWCGNGAVYKSGVAGSGGGGCAAAGALAAGIEGTMQYDTGTNQMVFCDGANWVNVPN